MPSKIDWRDLGQNIGRDSSKLESQRRGGSIGVIASAYGRLAIFALLIILAISMLPFVIVPG
jgi:hypothetical protein